MTGRSSTKRERFWRELLARHAGSGLSVRQFCGAEGVSEQSFYQWRKRFAAATRPVVDNASSVASRPSVQDGSGLFLPMGLLGGSPRAKLEILHPTGCRVRLVGAVSAQDLRVVLEVLDKRAVT